VGGDERHHRAQVRHAGGHRHRDGEDVVDEQRARHRHPELRPQVDRGHLVVAAARRVRVHVLPVGRHHGDHHHGHRQRDPRRVHVGGGTRDRQRQQDLVGRVGHRRERVGGEHGKRDALREQRVLQPVRSERATHEQPLENRGGTRHRFTGYG
jgi:hypothetical protein